MMNKASIAVVVCGLLMVAACTAPSETEEVARAESAQSRPQCDLVRCPMPLCIQGQHLAYVGGSCCPSCVGPQNSCATVLCAAVTCPEGQQLVTSPGDCCGHCVAQPPVKECTSDADCPQYYCIQCPCPYSICQGNKCVTKTPSESTCGGGTL